MVKGHNQRCKVTNHMPIAAVVMKKCANDSIGTDVQQMGYTVGAAVLACPFLHVWVLLLAL